MARSTNGRRSFESIDPAIGRKPAEAKARGSIGSPSRSAVLSVVPSVGGILSLMGMGAVVLVIWRTWRADTAATPIAAPVADPSGG